MTLCCLSFGFFTGTISGSCLNCPAHSTNQGDSSTCTACDAGYERLFNSISSQCTPCGSNEVSVSGAACTRCFSGEVANGQHTECVQCPAVCDDMCYRCMLVCVCLQRGFIVCWAYYDTVLILRAWISTSRAQPLCWVPLSRLNCYTGSFTMTHGPFNNVCMHAGHAPDWFNV
jgi:hypothetical protein